ncbi:hypothetical protein AB9F35_05735 [Rhizobium leguminosarum]|uniref:hypothetical protein n=1 Tax=Rhizobium leguminosarum TaxID=384 RepID=UPI003F975E65
MSQLKQEIQQLAADLGVFADIGTDAPSIVSTSDGYVIRFVRNGEKTELISTGLSAPLIERFGGEEVKHVSFKSLLASDRYGNVRDWVAKQAAYISVEMAAVGSLIQVGGALNNGATEVNLPYIDDFLISAPTPDSTRVLLIDGPAGIGKTQFILGLAERRVQNYSHTRRPLILHVQSRGRTLSYLYDLIAFSLQRMRLEVTFDQVPILAKYGLITIAIDGFDELADPDGYDQAWSQVSDIVRLLRGAGTLILAGRETFIGKDRVLNDISSLRADRDEISVLTLQPPSKGTAIGWLRNEGWAEDQVSAIQDYLEPSSLALRPFFLKTLSDPDVAKKIELTTATSVLSILMEAMIEREIGKFGDAVERVLAPDELRVYLRTFISEVARDMAESSSSAISDATLAWLVEMSLPKEIPDDVIRILKARSHVLAFFTNDDRKGYRRFFHEKFYEYFLSAAIIDLVKGGDTGKVLGRSILGSSFFETFSEVVSGGVHSTRAKLFLENTLRLVREYPPIDRTRKNLASLAISSLAIADSIQNFQLADVDIDESRFFGTSTSSKLSGLVINQFDCRGANISATRFENVSILTLISDAETLLPDNFPRPTRVRDVTRSGETLFSPSEIDEWVISHLENQPVAPVGLIASDLKDHPAMKLLHRACRLRQYWLRRGDDVYASRILDDVYWWVIEECLLENNLLRVEIRQASGSDARFIHIRQSDAILREDRTEPDVKKMYSRLSSRLRSMQ